MEVKTSVSIHNRFDFIVRDAETEEVIQTAKAENIIVDQIYDRVLKFNTYFNYIIFGKGDSTPLATDKTMGVDKIGAKAVEAHSLVRAFPKSTWTQKIRLSANEFNEEYIREVGIGYDATNLCTHALITDSVDKPLEIKKTSTRIIDIYATVYVTLYDVDWGLAWVGDGFRNYLTGATMAAHKVDVSFGGYRDDDTGVTGSATDNKGEKWIKIKGEFDENYFNKDIQYIHWGNGGLRAAFPRTDVFAEHQRTDVVIGSGNGEDTVFILPNKNVGTLVVKVDGNITGVTYDSWDKVTFDVAPESGKSITASYKCGYIPKDENHLLKVEFKIQFGASKPTAVMPDKPLPNLSGLPGVSQVIAGSSDFGYFGVVSAENLISGDDLCEFIGLTAGTSQYSDAGWLKYADENTIKFVAKKTIRYNISWNNIDAVGAALGDATIKIGNHLYKIRLLSTQEWDRLIYPIHKDHSGGAPIWDNFENADIQVASGNGRYTWTSTKSGSDRVSRGGGSVSYSGNDTPSTTNRNCGFRPVLEVL